MKTLVDDWIAQRRMPPAPRKSKLEDMIVRTLHGVLNGIVSLIIIFSLLTVIWKSGLFAWWVRTVEAFL